MSDNIISLETERACLATLLQINTVIPDVMAFIKPEFFSFSIHSTIYSLITATYQDKGSVDNIILTTRLRQLGINSIDEIDPFTYINMLNGIHINKDFHLDYFKELVKFNVARKTYNALTEARKYIVKNLNKPLNDIIHEVDKKVTEAVTTCIDDDVEIVDLYDSMPYELSKRAESGKEPALITNFPMFDKWYGGLYFGDMYVFAAPAKKGKSTFLNYLAYKVASHKQNNVKVLYLDTELETWRVICRSASSLTEINEWFFKNGKFKNDPNMVAKVNQMFDVIQPVKNKIYHAYVANRSIDEIISICRRWYVKHIKPGENAMIAYDYIKLDGANTGLSEYWKEYQAIGEKTDKLKKFASSVPNLALITSIQTNANCDIAMSQQLKWYASNVYILKPKDIIEYQDERGNFGTHKLIEIATRNQGEDAKGMKNVIKVKNPNGTEEYREDYINFKFDKFKVIEMGTYSDVLNQKAATLDPTNKDSSYDEIDF